jgi:hypothetical protein
MRTFDTAATNDSVLGSDNLPGISMKLSPSSGAMARSRVILECGADAAPLDENSFHFGPWCIQMEVPWGFLPGTCLEIKIRADGSDTPQQIEAVVASCARICGDPPKYSLILLYLEKETMLPIVPDAESAGLAETAL